jgi:hypothetical protein
MVYAKHRCAPEPDQRKHPRINSPTDHPRFNLDNLQRVLSHPRINTLVPLISEEPPLERADMLRPRIVSPNGVSGDQSQTLSGSAATVNGSERHHLESPHDDVPATHTVTTRAGRVVKQLVLAKPLSKKQQAAEVDRDFENKIQTSARYQALLAEASSAKTPHELIAAETELFKARHSNGKQGIQLPAGGNLQHLFKFLEMKSEPQEFDADSDLKERGKRIDEGKLAGMASGSIQVLADGAPDPANGTHCLPARLVELY